MRNVWFVTTLCAIVGAGTAAAAEVEFQVTPRMGVGHLHVDRFEGVDQDELRHADTIGIGCGAGLLTPIGVVFELGVDFFTEGDLFNFGDSFDISQEFLSVGYQFELGNGWRLVPRVGRARWELHSDEGWLFNPGPEETREIRGYNYFWEVGVARRLNRVLTLGAAYKQGDFDFGDSRSASVVLTLGF